MEGTRLCCFASLKAVYGKVESMSRAVHFNRPNGDVSTYWLESRLPLHLPPTRACCKNREYEEHSGSSSSSLRQHRSVVAVTLSSSATNYFAHQARAAFSQSVCYSHRGDGGSQSAFNQEVERMLLDPTSYARRRSRV